MFPQYFLSLVVSFVVTWVATPRIATLATKYGLVDRPDTRRLHSNVTPLGGGIAVFLGFYAAIALLYLCRAVGLADPFLFGASALFAASTFIVAVGLVDDRTALSPLEKLFGQTIAALILFAGNVRISAVLPMHVPFLLDLGATMLWYLVIINSLNLIDGMDGLATGISSVAAIGLTVTFSLVGAGAHAPFCGALLGATLAFICYNRHPASIFLGDAGSMLLGLVLGALPLLSGDSEAGAVSGLVVPALLLAIPILDTSLAIWRRCVRVALAYLMDRPRPRGFMSADLDHVHHRLLRRGFQQSQVCLALCVATALLAVAGNALLVFPQAAIGIALLALLVGGYALVYHVADLELWDTGLAIVQCLAYRRKPRLARALELLLLGVLFGCAAGCSIAIVPSLAEGSPLAGWVDAALLLLPGVYTISLLESLEAECAESLELQLVPLALYCALVVTSCSLLNTGVFAPLLFTLVRTILFVGLLATAWLGLKWVPASVERSLLRRLRDADEARLYGLAFDEDSLPTLAVSVGVDGAAAASRHVSPGFQQLLETVEATVDKQRELLAAVLLDDALPSDVAAQHSGAEDPTAEPPPVTDITG